MPLVYLADTRQLHGDEPLCVTVAGQEILLFQIGDEVVAVANHCPHLGRALKGGVVVANVIQCPAHGWKFDLKTGCIARYWWVPPMSRRARVRLSRYRVVLDGSRILVEVPA